MAQQELNKIKQIFAELQIEPEYLNMKKLFLVRMLQEQEDLN